MHKRLYIGLLGLLVIPGLSKAASICKIINDSDRTILLNWKSASSSFSKELSPGGILHENLKIPSWSSAYGEPGEQIQFQIYASMVKDGGTGWNLLFNLVERDGIMYEERWGTSTRKVVVDRLDSQYTLSIKNISKWGETFESSLELGCK